MPQNKYISNNFSKGLNLDVNVNSQPENTYRFAMGAINRDFNQLSDLSNEHSDRLGVDLGSQIIGYGYVDERDEFVVFTREGLYLVDIKTSTKTLIAKDSEFNCDWHFDTCKWITPQFKTMDPCAETFVYWSSSCEYFKLNIDEMLNRTRKQAIIDSMKQVSDQCSDITCEYFHVFKISCQPRLIPVAYKQGGGGLLAGAYQFAVRLKNNEGGETNWFTISNPVYLGGEDNAAGEITDGLIEINITDLDCNFDYGELAVIKTVGGIITTSLVTRFNYTNYHYTYTYTGNEIAPIDIGEIITRGKTYLQGQDLVQHNGNMFYFNIRQAKNLNFQKRVIEDVRTSWIKYRIPYELAKKYNFKSYMRGETYGFAVKYNSVDGRSTRGFHIAPNCESGNTGNDFVESLTSNSPEGTINSQPGDLTRTRSSIPDTVRNPQLDELDNQLSDNIDSLTTTPLDLCEAATDCEDCDIAATDCNADMPIIQEMIGDFGGTINGLNGGQADDLTIDYSYSTIKEAAQNIMDSVKNRERKTYVAKALTVDKGNVVHMRSSSDGEFHGEYSGPYFDKDGTPMIELIVDRQSLGCSIVKEEDDILYPDQKDCEGEYIYGDLANQPVRHHQVPWTSEVVHFVSNSIGVPSVATPDADEYKDAFVDIIGVQFRNIPLPTEEELGFKLCDDNPFTILQIPRTSQNKTIHSKGLITSTLLSSNDGKDYLYPTHGLNSEDSTVNRYIKTADGSRLDAAATFQEHYNFWSLDTMVKAHALNVNQVRVEGIASGIGYRHGQSEIGIEPADTKYGSRIDQRGTRQAINLNRFTQEANGATINYKIYAPSNEVISPPEGAPAALMNKYQQESVWFGAPLGTLTDRSFKGDVLEHDAPISDAQAYYVALIRDIPNQYGDLTNMPYMPILEAGQKAQHSIEGMCGDTFIGPHSFVRTSYVSDKVGDKFPIENMVPGKADRCICDSPEDAIHSYNGMWISSTLPIDGDAADAKNWAGLHTVPGAGGISHTWAQSQLEVPISDFYYNKVVKTLITYWGEFEVNPHMRQRGDNLEDQVYNKIKPLYGLDSSIESNSGNGWDKDYLNQFYWEVQQPSKWKIEKKTLIRTLLVTLGPLLGIAELLSPSTAFQFLGELGSAGLIAAVWAVLSKVLFSNDYIDEFLGIPICKQDSEGGEKDRYIKNFFQNYNKWNRDFTIQNNIEVHYGLPVPYYTCDCDDCDNKTTNEIYISDEQRQGSSIDAYSIVRPKSHVNVSPSMGSLTDIFVNGSNLYAHTTEQIIPLQYGRSTIPTSTSDIILGPGPILAKPIGLTEGTSEGFAGLLSRQHAINTQYGRFFIDYKASKLYKFANGLTQLSGEGVYTHFRKKLKYCETGECENEHINPNDIALGIDPRLERLLVTKRAIDEEQSWTLSFDLLENHWVSFHAYKPNFYAWDRYHMISSDGQKLWVHDNDSKFQTFRDKYSPYIIEFVVNDHDIIKEIFKGGHLDTFAVKGDLYDREVTFNKLWARNNHQSTGFVNLITETTENGLREDTEFRTSEIMDVRLTRVDGMWNYNNLYDLTVNTGVPTYSSDQCTIDITPINLKEAVDSTAFTNSIHLNNYLVVRLIFDNFDDYKLYTRSHNILNRKDPQFIQ